MLEPLIHQIVLPDVGVVFPWERTKNGQARCKQCGRTLRLGGGYRLETITTGSSRTHRGFICLGCLAGELRRTTFWTYVQETEMLRPASQGKATNILAGLTLAAFLEGSGGLEGMEQAMKDNLHFSIMA